MAEENNKIALAKNLEEVAIDSEMKASYLDYAMSVIVGRAIPDLRDGLKPVHRRTIYSMHLTASHYNQPYKKSARIVGEVMGKFHPHGDAAIYDALVRMAQDFSLRYPLVDGQGNFGSIDGDPPAAMRYTEARLTKFAQVLLNDLEKNTVNFISNYDGTLQEPEIFPSAVPMLLLNGVSGIAVGMATSIPPHNIAELIDAFVCFIDNPEVSVDQLMKIMPGPDFPTGGFIFGRDSIKKAYETGKGSLVIRAKATVETDNKGRQKIVFTEIPFLCNKSKILESIANLIKERRIEGVTDLRDESDREGIRIVLDLKRDENPERILKALYKYTQLQSNFSIIFLAILDNQPRQFTLPEYFSCFLEHRKEVVRRRSLYELEKAEKRAHIIEGLKIALKNIELVIKLIRQSKNRSEARQLLIEKLSLTTVQSDAILDLQLYRLTSLEIDKLDNEYLELLKQISFLKELLASEKMLLNVIKSEMLKIKEEFADKRRTTIVDAELTETNLEDLIKDEDFVIFYTRNGYIKRTTLSAYRNQNRTTMGKKGFTLKEEDSISKLYVAAAKDYLLVFTERGRLYWLKVYDIPEGDLSGRGRPIQQLLPIGEEKICSLISVKEFSSELDVLLFSKNGYVKKTPLSDFSRPRSSGIIAASVDDGDSLLEAVVAPKNSEVILGTNLGKAIIFNVDEIREMGRNARGVIAIRLDKGDFVIGADLISPKQRYILTCTENGFGKKSDLSLYRRQKRGGKGILNIKVSERIGRVVGLVTLDEDLTEIVISSLKGNVKKLDTMTLRPQGRATQGVRIINLRSEDRVVAVEKINRISD